MILTALTACDNVSWGGVELRLDTPERTDTAAAGNDTAAVDTTPPPLELGPALFTARPDGETVRLVPVGILASEGLQAFPDDDEIPDVARRFQDERMPTERRFALFSGGTRVGTFFPDSAGAVDSTYCAPRPTALGRIEILPAAMESDDFLALPLEIGEDYGRAEFDPVTTTGAQRAASLRMAASLFTTLEIRWPPSVRRARADIEVFRPTGSESELVAATFLYGDSLAIGGAPENAYSLFFLGVETDGEYDPIHVRYREVGVHGKSVARFIDHLDWDGDGEDEVLLEEYGLTGRWYAGLSRTAGEWEEIFREDCEDVGEGETTAEGASAESSSPGRVEDPGF